MHVRDWLCLIPTKQASELKDEALEQGAPGRKTRRGRYNTRIGESYNDSVTCLSSSNIRVLRPFWGRQYYTCVCVLFKAQGPEHAAIWRLDQIELHVHAGICDATRS